MKRAEREIRKAQINETLTFLAIIIAVVLICVWAWGCTAAAPVASAAGATVTHVRFENADDRLDQLEQIQDWLVKKELGRMRQAEKGQ